MTDFRKLTLVELIDGFNSPKSKGKSNQQGEGWGYLQANVKK